MKIEQANQITEQALDKLIQALEAGKSDALKAYLKGRGGEISLDELVPGIPVQHRMFCG
jgi:hypothetical protein